MIPTVDITFAIAEPRYAQKNAMRKQDSVIWPEQRKLYRKLLLHNQEGEKIAGHKHTTCHSQKMCLPCESVEHPTNGNAGQNTVITPQAKVDVLERRSKSKTWKSQ